MQCGVIIIKQHDPGGVEWKQTTHSFWERTIYIFMFTCPAKHGSP